MELKKHAVWEVIVGAQTFDSYQENILEIVSFNSSVPQEIKNAGRTIEKLLLHSYYEYDFIDIALTQAIVIFEKALRMKWFELYQKPSRKENFEKLIEWFIKENNLEERHRQYLTMLREMRNEKVHDTEETVMGVIFFNAIYNIFDLINIAFK